MAQTRSAKVGLVTRTVANAAAALRTVPAGLKSMYVCLRAVCACVHTRRHWHARYRRAGARRCDGRRASNCFARAGLTSAAESASACCCTASATREKRARAPRLSPVRSRPTAKLSLGQVAGRKPPWPQRRGGLVVTHGRHWQRLCSPTLASPPAVAPSIPPTAHKLPSIHARAAFAARASLDWPHRLPCVTR